MKKKIIVTVVLLFTALLPAQVFGPRHLITEDAGSISGLRSGDLDADGDIDLMSITSSILGWQENLDGLGNFGALIDIAPGMGQSLDQKLIDLDQDDKLDIIISYFDNDIIAWYRNLGNGNFAAMQTLASGLNSASGIEPGDVDGDGDLDLVLGVTNGVGFYWIEHLDGNGTFGPLIPINTTLSQARMQRLGDIDGDGDLDILTNAVGGTILAWFENTDGNGSFSTQKIIENSGQYENSFYLADLDGDEDLDIFSLSDRAFWRENTNGQGSFIERETLYTANPGFIVSNLQVFDIDNNNTFDVCFTTTEGAGYSLNDGNGNFSSIEIITPLADFSPDGIMDNNDIDNDGDKDILSRARDLGATGIVRNTYWLENTTILDTDTYAIEGLIISPNPVDNIFSIKSIEPLKQAVFYHLLGQQLKTIKEDFTNIDISFLSTGIYFVEVQTSNGKVLKKIVKR